MSTTGFRRVAAVAWLFQALIVASGAAVRLTKSGLGCSDWPNCNEGTWVPEAEFHDWVEYGNRLISLVVTATTLALLVAAYRRRPRRHDLVTLGWWLVGGTVGQVVLGGITVLLDLNPVVVSLHFLISMGLLWVAGLAWWRSGERSLQPRPAVSLVDRRLAIAVAILATAVLVTGTVVTGSGPHSGDDAARRLGFELVAVVRIHAVMVWSMLASLLWLAVRLSRRSTNDARVANGARFARLTVLATVAQGAIGYTQYALGVPAELVEAHVVGAVTVWVLLTVTGYHLFDRSPVATAAQGNKTAPVGAAQSGGNASTPASSGKVVL